MVKGKEEEILKERKTVIIKNTYIPAPNASQNINIKNSTENCYNNSNGNKCKFKQRNLLIHNEHETCGNNYIRKDEFLKNNYLDFSENIEIENKKNETDNLTIPVTDNKKYEHFYKRQNVIEKEERHEEEEEEEEEGEEEEEEKDCNIDSNKFSASIDSTTFKDKWGESQYCCYNNYNEMKLNEMKLNEMKLNEMKLNDAYNTYYEYYNNEKRECSTGYDTSATNPDLSIHDNFFQLKFKLNEQKDINENEEFRNNSFNEENSEIEIEYELEDEIPIGGNELFLQKIKKQCNGLTTVMLKNIPNKYTQHMLIDVINERFLGLYNFIYLPIDFRNKRNVGYAFINFVHPHYAQLFIHFFSNYKLKAFKSNKICAVAWGKVQGLNAIVQHYKKSSIMKVPYAQYKPTFFQNGVMVSWPQLFTMKKGDQQKKINGTIK